MKKYYRVIYGIDDFVEVVELKGDTEDDNVLSAKINCQDYLSENIGSNSVVEYLGSDESAAFKLYEDSLELDELKNAIKVLKRCPQLARLKAHTARAIREEPVENARGWLDCIEFITNGGLLGLPKTHPKDMDGGYSNIGLPEKHPMDRPNRLGKVKDLLEEDEWEGEIPPKSEWKNISLGIGTHLEQSIINEVVKKKK